ncbi:MAG: ABC transporter ATP-binding protein [Propionicimonas sp.]|nr:ABC transporter ATP-binding protein [Propionicimonas sp.]
MTAARVTGLRIGVGADGPDLLDGVDLALAPGEVVGVAGETGSGKTTLGLALLGHLAPGLRLRSGRVEVGGQVVAGAGGVLPRVLLGLRGRSIAYVPQDPGGALPPHLRLAETMTEVARAHGVAGSLARCEASLATVGLPPGFATRYPHELSGGQQQRAAIAIAFSLDPDVVVLDEPTTGLDVTTKGRIRDLVATLAGERGTAVVFISHDLPLLFGLAQRLVVMHEGGIVETGTPQELLTGARHPYTRRLLAAWRPAGMPSGSGVDADRHLLTVTGLSARYGDTVVTHDIDLQVSPGECLALVGESGSGKTTTARAIAGLHPSHDGRLQFLGDPLAPEVERRAPAQRRAIQYVFQNPWGSLNPRRRVGGSVAIAARELAGLGRRDALERARRALTDVGLRPDHADAMPQQLSGGQRQRAALARALVSSPDLLVCDEVTSSLDASVQADIVELLRGIQAERRLAMLFITHDLALAGAIAHRVAVLKDGHILEQGPTGQVLGDPSHAYTRELVAAASLG